MKITGPKITDFPLYTSEGGLKSLWQKYIIYPDKLVLKTLLRTITISYDEFDKAEIRPPNIKVMLNFNFFAQNFKLALKLDFVDFNEHLAINKKSGTYKILLITPDNLSIFKEYLDRAVDSYRRSKTK